VVKKAQKVTFKFMDNKVLLNTIGLLVIGFIGVIIYFIPTYIAFKRKCTNFNGITILNIFLGWTFLGWVGSLVWAAIDKVDSVNPKKINILIKLAGIVMVIGVITASLIFAFVYNKAHKDFEKMKPDHTLSASELYNSCIANTTGSETKYNGKVIEVTGTLTKVESTDSLVIAVFVFNQGMFGDEGIRCTMLPKFNEEAKKLQPGNQCNIKGYCTGFNDPDVILEQCSIIK
jgi:hypothetical protein